MIRVLFVCLGNICRSPTAEGIFRARLIEEGLAPFVNVDSCGTGHWHVGEPPDARACREAAQRGLSIDALRARQLATSDYEFFDYLLAMDKDNLALLQERRPDACRAHIGLLLDFSQDRSVCEVPDPYYGGDDDFSRVYELIDAASTGLIAHIRAQHRLDDATVA